MTIRSSRRALRSVALAAAGSTAAVLLAALPSSAAVIYSLPGAPSAVTATAVAGGTVVTWSAPNDGNATITAYSVSGGPGSCAVSVPGSARSAFVPAVAGQKATTYKVVATNSLGDSDAGAAGAAVTPLATADAVRAIGADAAVGLSGAALPVSSDAESAVAAASTRDGQGLWVLDGKGTVSASGSAAAITAALPGAVAIVPSVDERGVTLVTRKGQVASFGTATLAAPAGRAANVVGAIGNADGRGLWIVRADGTITSVGTAARLARLKGAVVKAVTGNPGRTGGWALLANGRIVTIGAATAVSGSVAKGVALWRTATGKGLWVAKADGSIANLGDAMPLGPANVSRVVALVGATNEVQAQAVTIDEFSDFHGQIEAQSSGVGGAAALKAWFDADKAAGPTIVASGGDNFGAAPPISAQFEELPTVLAENKMGLDISTLGNHEHDRPLAHLQKMIDNSTFSWVSSNYANFGGLTGIAPYRIIERGGVKVAFVGANNPETAQVATKDALGSITFTPPASGVNDAIVAARKAGAQVVVALLHIGYAETIGDQASGDLLATAKAIKGADLIFGAHTHIKWSGRVNGTLVSETANAGANYIRNTVCRDAGTGSVIGTAGEVVTPLVKSVTPDADIAAFVKGYAEQIAAKFDTKLATIKGVFPFGGSPAIQRQGETAIGDYIAEIVRAKYNTDIVIVNGGGIRANIPALGYVPKDTTLSRPKSATDSGTYDITLGDIYTVLPFGNQLATTTITGAGIWSALENGVSQVENNAGRFPQVSGLKFTFDPKKPAGARVTSVTLANGTPIANDASKTYTLTTLDYMITGGDGYTQFNPSKAYIRDLYAQVVADAVTAQKSVTIPALDGRITRL